MSFILFFFPLKEDLNQQHFRKWLYPPWVTPSAKQHPIPAIVLLVTWSVLVCYRGARTPARCVWVGRFLSRRLIKTSFSLQTTFHKVTENLIALLYRRENSLIFTNDTHISLEYFTFLHWHFLGVFLIQSY